MLQPYKNIELSSLLEPENLSFLVSKMAPMDTLCMICRVIMCLFQETSFSSSSPVTSHIPSNPSSPLVTYHTLESSSHFNAKAPTLYPLSIGSSNGPTSHSADNNLTTPPADLNFGHSLDTNSPSAGINNKLPASPPLSHSPLTPFVSADSSHQFANPTDQSSHSDSLAPLRKSTGVSNPPS